MKMAVVIAVALVTAACKPQTEPQVTAPAESATPIAVEPTAPVEQPASAPAPASGQVAETPSSVEKQNVLTFAGYSGIKLGMAEAEFLKSQQGNIRQIERLDPEPDACHYAFMKSPDGMLVMLENRKVMRIGSMKSLENSLGINPGDDMAAVKTKFPAAERSQHAYVEAAHELTIWDPARKAAFLVEGNDKGKVESVRVGLPPNVHYVEGCA